MLQSKFCQFYVCSNSFETTGLIHFILGTIGRLPELGVIRELIKTPCYHNLR